MYAVYENKAREYKVFIAKIQHYQKMEVSASDIPSAREKARGPFLKAI